MPRVTASIELPSRFTEAALPAIRHAISGMISRMTVARVLMIDAASKWASTSGMFGAKIEAQNNTAVPAIVAILQVMLVKVSPRITLVMLGKIKRGASTIPAKTLVGKLIPTASLIVKDFL